MLTINFAFSQVPTGLVRSDKMKIDAERFWEQIVEARGGRRKLHSITNAMITKGSHADDIQRQFYVYPDRYWEWNKATKFYNLLFVKMANLDAGIFQVASHDGLATNRPNLAQLQRANYREGYLMETCSFLLETRWLKPTPIRTTSRNVDKIRYDVIETRFPSLQKYTNWGLNFYVDPESLSVVGVEKVDEKGEAWQYYSFKDYADVNGIKVPRQYAVVRSIQDLKKAAYGPVTFRFNIDYDKTLFERPPSAEAGPDAWKPKTKVN
jgi:hypothetical protein